MHITKSFLLPLLIFFSACAHTNSAERTITQANFNPSPVDSSKWRGFNLMNMFWLNWKDSSFEENDFKWIKEFGFNFVRLPLDYRIWTDEKNLFSYKEEKLKRLDEAIQLGQKYGIHVCINLHRAPGYTVSESQPEKRDLWKDEEMQKAFLHQWTMFASRYKDIPAESLSFNLLN